jgi:DNA-damage-inducible protein J
MDLIQVRVDSETKKAAAALFEALGMDLSTAIRSFLKKAIAVDGMPFDMKLDESTLKAMSAIEAMRTVSEENGNSEMTLDDINAEIAKARKERKAKR